MCGPTCQVDPNCGLALVLDGYAQARRLANYGVRGRHVERSERVEERRDADAAEFFVARHGDVERATKRARIDFRYRCEHRGDEPLHVGGAAPVEPIALTRQRERIPRPRLALHGHDVAVRRQE